MPREKTPEQRLAWATYMRKYRRERAGTSSSDPRGKDPTPRQIEVLRAYADPDHGGTQKATAEYLEISVSAVNNTLQRLTKRLGVKDPAQAVFLLRYQLDELPDASPSPVSRTPRRTA